jgi:hypothetical protein
MGTAAGAVITITRAFVDAIAIRNAPYVVGSEGSIRRRT